MKITITGDKEVVAALGKVGNAFQIMEEPLDLASKGYMDVIATNFADGGVTFGDKWKDLSKRAIQTKRAEHPGKFDKEGKPMLVRTGEMKKSFGFDIKNKESIIFNAKEYAAYHQDGYPMLGIPKRILADVDDKRINMVAKTFETWIQKLLNKEKL